MAHVEFEGRDLEEAIGRAASALNLPPEQVKFSILSTGTRGFLGLGRRKARIAVDPDDPVLSLEEPEDRVRPEGPPPPPAPPRTEPGDARLERGKKPAPAATGAPARPERPGRAQTETRPQPAKERRPEPARAALGSPEAPAKRPGRRPAEALPKETAPPLDWSHLPPVATRPARGETLVEGPGGPAGELALQVTGEIVTRLGFAAEIRAARLGSRIVLSLESADNALLIGARGATLEALQLLVNKIVARRLAESSPAPESARVVLDVADYRSRRREQVLDTLKNLAEQARRTRRPQTMTGLSADERRLVQLALRPFKDLRALSSGGRDGLVIRYNK